MLKPKIETSSLGLYSAEQQEELRNGKTIIANSPSDIKNGDFGVKCFVQYDEDTNQVLSVPTQAIGENIRVLTDILGLDYETVRAMQQGEPQSVEWQNSERNTTSDSTVYGRPAKMESLAFISQRKNIPMRSGMRCSVQATVTVQLSE